LLALFSRLGVLSSGSGGHWVAQQLEKSWDWHDQASSKPENRNFARAGGCIGLVLSNA
jgi:hypothetical protein